MNVGWMTWGAVALVCLPLVACKKSEARTTSEGRELFTNACARCHGQEGAGGLPLFTGGPSPRNFRDHGFQASRTDDELKTAIRSGKGTGMPPFGTTFDDRQLTDLVAQIRSFDSERTK